MPLLQKQLTFFFYIKLSAELYSFNGPPPWKLGDFHTIKTGKKKLDITV